MYTEIKQVVLFDVAPVLRELSIKYGLFQPYTPRQCAVLSEYFIEALARVFSLSMIGAENSPHEYLTLYGNWHPSELALINDVTFDTILTQTIHFEMMNVLTTYLYFVPRILTTTLILEGY